MMKERDGSMDSYALFCSFPIHLVSNVSNSTESTASVRRVQHRRKGRGREYYVVIMRSTFLEEKREI